MHRNLIQVPVHFRALAFLMAAGLIALAVAACGGATDAPAATAAPGGDRCAI